MPSHRITISRLGALEGGDVGGPADATVRRAIGRYFIIPARTTTTTTAAATPAPVDVLVSDEEEDGRVVIGRKRAHSAVEATGSPDRCSATAAAGDRWRERRGYI